jgi:tight adherence protein B
VTNLWRRWHGQRRLAAMAALLAQDFEGMAGSLRSGASLIQAVQNAAQSAEGPLAEEWRFLLKEVQLGASLEQALGHLRERVPLPAMQSFATGVILLQETGGPLAGMLSALARSLREEAAFQGKLRALTAQGRISGYVVSAMPFLLLCVLTFLSPELMRPLYVTSIGWGLLSAVVLMVAVGGWMIKKIVTIEI